MVYLQDAIVVVVGGSLVLLGLYFGFKLSLFRRHRKSEELQTLKSVHKLDEPRE